MKKIIILLFLFTISHSYASEIKFEKIFDDLNKPWSLSFINQESIIYTEKKAISSYSYCLHASYIPS